jgi:hypothetical protein
MILIRNISPKVRATGIHEYEIRINRDLIAKFKHKREEGLSVCLRKASEAVYDELILKPTERLVKELTKSENTKKRKK